MRPRIYAAVICLTIAALCVSCEGNADSAGTKPASTARTSSSATPSGTPGRTVAAAVLADMTDAERVGQLFMIGCPSTTVTDTCLTAIRDDKIGSVILNGNSTLSIEQQASVTAALQAAAAPDVRLFIATDQEGGLVQRMRGPGFTGTSTAREQGTWATSDLQHQATLWGQQLVAAGINVDLAPVLDTVPPGAHNPPIGDLDRGYGQTPAIVSRQGNAVARGLAAGGVSATAKHFPGLGRVTENTDTAAHVVDDTTTATDPTLLPFITAIRAKIPFMMMSTAVYSRIDDGTPAAFSQPIVTGLLRQTLGFRGVVISDDLGAATQVADYPVAARAVRFIEAGGDLVLTVQPNQAHEMASAVVSRMGSDSAFRRQVDAAAMQILTAKQARGLLEQESAKANR